VIDHDRAVRLKTLPGFIQAAGVAADQGEVLVTNRGAASLAWVDAAELSTKAVFDTGPRPNGVATVVGANLGLVACIGDEARGPGLHAIELASGRWLIHLPGRPRWCVTDTAGQRVYLAIRDPSMILVASLPKFTSVQHWPAVIRSARPRHRSRE
jgi:hypothetical protein